MRLGHWESERICIAWGKLKSLVFEKVAGGFWRPERVLFFFFEGKVQEKSVQCSKVFLSESTNLGCEYMWVVSSELVVSIGSGPVAAKWQLDGLCLAISGKTSNSRAFPARLNWLVTVQGSCRWKCRISDLNDHALGCEWIYPNSKKNEFSRERIKHIDWKAMIIDYHTS